MHLEGLLLEDRKGDTLLYAGDLKIRITDWFFFKKKAELKYIGLDNALIRFQRQDSVWSQQFLFDYFSPPPSSTKTNKKGIAFSLQKAELNNVVFEKKDAWLGEDLSAFAGKLLLDADDLQLSGNTFNINSLSIDKPIVKIRSYERLKPRSTTSSEDDTGPESWNNKSVLKIKSLAISNGTFSTDKESGEEPLSYFDGKHILVTNINGLFANTVFAGDSILSQVKLKAEERSGLELKNLTANFKMTPQEMTFADMELVTNRSTIRNYYSMSYNSMKDLGDYINKVNMQAVFDDSYVDSDDIAFFAPALSSWKKKIKLQGKVRGTVNEMIGRDMVVESGNSTMLNGDISLSGLPDIERTFIDFRANDFRTTYGDAVTIVPSLRRVTSPDLRQMQYISFKGSFTGFIRDFVTYGTITTNLGTVVSDLNMKLPAGQPPAYSGNIATENFSLGRFLGNNEIGNISMKGTVKGRGFTSDTRNTLLDGDIRFIDYNGYRFNEITLNGTLIKNLFSGTGYIRDQNLEMDMNGTINLLAAKPGFDLTADVHYSNFKNLNLTSKNIELKGKLNLNFIASSPEDFLGTIRMTESEIKNEGLRIPFDSLIVVSSIEEHGRRITAQSNEFEAEISGDFKITAIPDAVAYLLNKYYPAYVKAPKKIPAGQDFDFKLSTQYADEYLHIFDPRLGGLNFSYLSGKINTDNNNLLLEADVPQFKFGKYNFDNVKLSATGTPDLLSVHGDAYNITINDSLSIPRAAFFVDAHNDSSKVSIISGANRNVDTANLNALVLTYEDGIKIEVDPSTFTINSKQWTIDENGELEFRSKSPASGKLVLTSGEQEVIMKTEPSSSGGDWNDLRVQLTKVNMGDFAPFFMPNNRLEGLISGNIVVEDPNNNLKIKSDDLKTEFLRLDNDSLGEVKASLLYDNKLKQLTAKGNTLNQQNYLGFDANIYFGDPEKTKNNLIALKAKEFQLSVLERFLGDLFSDMQGYLTGDVTVSGDFSDLAVTGKGRLKDAGLKVNFTQCFYKIKDTEVNLTPQEIDLDGWVLTDTVTGNPIYITGGIEHDAFKNMFYNLDVSTRKPSTRDDANNKPVLLLNTTYSDNNQFYGKVKGTGSFSLLGPQANMYMKIDAIASDKDSSYITIPPATSRESGIADFLVEKKYGREMVETDVKVSNTNIVYDVDVTANPMVNVKVVLDDLTGDEIKGRGNGALNIRSGTSEPLSLRGRFNIEEGSYLFTFQSFFKKPFEIKKGANNYIEWVGDPYDANIRFEATYKAERVSYAPLASSLSLNTSGISNAREDVFVVATLTDKLFKPKIDFALNFLTSSVAVTDPELALLIQQMQKNENEINRQVTYLIVFNSFAPSELGGTAEASKFNPINTISGIFLNVISDRISKLLGNLLKDDKYIINLNTSIYNRNPIDQGATSLNLGSNVNFSVGRAFFNNRFIISTGVGLETPIQQQTSNLQQSIQFLPDVKLEWLINETGTVRASFFYIENTDYFATTSKNARRVGGNISFKKDFNRLSDIFKKRPKKSQPAENQEPENKEATVPENKTVPEGD
ncbi:MAG: translocation/assembly module TamB domain-containing protein [Chitinophagales bacterium]|nr:translocation/assembly module TamB domain-containing protein [Chitinophagales bacterium]